jgi:hypothetical protein
MMRRPRRKGKYEEVETKKAEYEENVEKEG